MTDAADTFARAVTRAQYAGNQVKKLKKQAGPALRDPEGVNAKMEAAIEKFSCEAYSNFTLQEIATYGNRIANHARQLTAAQQLPAAETEWEQRSGEARDLQPKASG